MAAVKVTLPVEDAEKATEIAAAIREAGSLAYTRIEGGDTVNIQVGDVTVES